MIIFQYVKINVHVWIGFTGKSKKENTTSGPEKKAKEQVTP